MIQIALNNEILNRLLAIERVKNCFGNIRLPIALTKRLRKSSQRKSSYSSNRIEGNPLTEEQAREAIDSSKRHYLKPEQEIRNYFNALRFLEKSLKGHVSFSKKLILEVQSIVVNGESREKIGIRKPMPPGVLFAVYDDKTGAAEYIPPAADEIETLLDELIAYVKGSDDHPIIKAAIVHYQLVTIHPFEDGNGRTARLMSDYILDLGGYEFNQIGSLEEYFAYDIDEYYQSLQMGLPVLCYDGRLNPPHPEIWINYFLRMMELHANKALELVSAPIAKQQKAGESFLGIKERKFLEYLRRRNIRMFAPIEIAQALKVSNRTVINWSVALVKNGFLIPNVTGKRVRAYSLTELGFTSS